MFLCVSPITAGSAQVHYDPGPVFIKPLRITLKNTAKNWLKWKKMIGSKLRLKFSYQSSQS